jgi:nucleoside-diphosphate-sugar epimerase
VATLRPFNTFGPCQSARAIIPTIISQALTGEVIQLGHLEPRRDFTYMADIIEGFIKAGLSSLGQLKKNLCPENRVRYNFIRNQGNLHLALGEGARWAQAGFLVTFGVQDK